MVDRPKITLPSDFELFRERSFDSRLPKKHVGYYLAAKKYSGLKNQDGSYVSWHDGSPVHDEFAFDPLLAPMGPSISVSGGGHWSEDRHGSVFDSQAQLLSLEPAVVMFSVDNMSNEGIIADVNSIQGGDPGFNYGSYIPYDVLQKIEDWVSKSEQYKEELRLRLNGEGGDQISLEAKDLYESASAYRAAASELLSFAKLRALQLKYNNVTCSNRQTLDFGSGRCVTTRSETDPRTSLSQAALGTGTGTGDNNGYDEGPFVDGGATGRIDLTNEDYEEGPFVGGGATGGITITNEDYEDTSQKKPEKKKSSKKKSGGSGILIAGAAVLGLLAFSGKK